MSIASFDTPSFHTRAGLPRAPLHWRQWAVRCAVVGLLTTAVAFRLWKLGSLPGINGDEAWSGVQAMHLLRGEPASWRTPTGNPLNPFFMGPLLLLHAVFAPSFTLLRAVAAASGILALAVNYWLCCRAFDRRTAVIGTVLLGVLPINIAYSRFAWDASQSLLATTFVAFLPLIALMDRERSSRWFVLSVVAFIAAVLVHPTNVFCAPLVAVPVLWTWRDEIADFARRRLARLPRWMTTVALPALGFLVGAWAAPWIAAVAVTVASRLEAARFLQNLLWLFSGSTVYRFLSGAVAHDSAIHTVQPFDVYDWATLGIAGLLGFGFCRALVAWRRQPDGCLAAGCLLTVLGFYVVAGPGAIAPHFERYATGLIAPIALVATRGIAWWLSPGGRRGMEILGVALVAGGVLLGSFYWRYFRFIEHTGGEAHLTFRTAGIEPKAAALRHVVEAGNGVPNEWIITEEWWNYWPLRYLAYGEINLDVAHWSELRLEEQADLARLWFVEFCGSEAERRATERLKSAGLRVERTSLVDYAGRPVLSVLRGVVKSAENY